MLEKHSRSKQYSLMDPFISYDENEVLRTRPGAEASLLNEGSCLARALGVTKLINMRVIILVTRCCATEVRPRRSTNPPLVC